MAYILNKETPEKFNLTYARFIGLQNLKINDEDETIEFLAILKIFKDRQAFLDGANGIIDKWMIYKVDFYEFAGLAADFKQMMYAIINNQIKLQREVNVENEQRKAKNEALTDEEKQNNELIIDNTTYATGFSQYDSSLEIELETSQEALITL